MSGDRRPTPRTVARFRQALYEAFDEPSIELLTSDYFAPDTFGKLSPPGAGRTFEVRLQEVIDQARMNDWFLDLVAAARERRPKNTEIGLIATELGLTVAGPRVDNPTGRPLEALIRDHARFITPATFYQRLPQLEAQVCWIRIPDGGGTGFLVGPDVILTARHVVAPLIDGVVSPADVRCLFDYRRPLGESDLDRKKPTVVQLASNWLMADWPPSPSDWGATIGEPAPGQIDCALVMLAEPVGDLPPGGSCSAPDARPRQWIDLTDDPQALVAGSQVFLLQHPGGEPLQMAVGTVAQFNRSGTRIRYDANSKRGSSGSPCLDADLRLVAVHHARDPHDPPEWNQAIPLGLITSALRDAGIVATTPQDSTI